MVPTLKWLIPNAYYIYISTCVLKFVQPSSGSVCYSLGRLFTVPTLKWDGRC